MTVFPRLLLVCAAFAAVQAQAAVHCAAPGVMAVDKANDGSGFIFFPSRAYGTTAFVVPGRDFRKDPTAASGMTQFFIDGIHYQFLTTSKAPFVDSGQAADDAALLAGHAKWEQAYMVKGGTPLTKFNDLGDRPRKASVGGQAFLFKMWFAVDPKKPDGEAQYFVSTVVGEDIAILTAMIPSAKHSTQLMAAFQMFASSFRFVSSKDACPAPRPNL
ncbi:MAG: hypothetical protein V4857_19765 [Pseudomonadota bacterium]